MVSIQEAVHEIMQFDLTLCSDTINVLSLSKCQALLHKKEKKSKNNDVVTMYMNRKDSHEALSLERYFYNVYCKGSSNINKESRILQAEGIQCKPVYPIDYNYARGMLWLHKPWRKIDCEEGGAMRLLLADEEKTKEVFKKMLDTPGVVPTFVTNQYIMAEK